MVDKIGMFQGRFGKIDEFEWWDLDFFSEDAGTQFTSTYFQGKCKTCGVWVMLAAPEHQEINGQVQVTWRLLRKITHSHMVHAQLLEGYINFTLSYMADNILPVIPIKDLINEYRNSTTPFKLVTGTRPSMSHLRVLFFTCVVQEATTNVGTKALNMSHQVQTYF